MSCTAGYNAKTKINFSELISLLAKGNKCITNINENRSSIFVLGEVSFIQS